MGMTACILLGVNDPENIMACITAFAYIAQAQSWPARTGRGDLGAGIDVISLTQRGDT